MSSLRKRLESVEERIALQQHRENKYNASSKADPRRAVILHCSRVLAGERRR